ncbi:peptidoglycan-binding protein [Kitasatospora herbaricolor]
MLLRSRATDHDAATDVVAAEHPTTAARIPSTGHRLPASAVPDNREGIPSADTTPVTGRPLGSSRRRHRRRDKRLLRFVPSPRRAAVGAAGLGIVAVGLGLAHAQPPTPRASVAPVLTPLTVGPDLPEAGASPSGSAHPSESANRSPAPTPTTSIPAATTPSQAPSPRPATPSPAPPGRTPSAEPSPSTTRTPPAVPPAVRTLQRGDQGPDVIRLQRLLIEAGCGTAAAPFTRGSFDAATENALRTFQREAGIRGEERDRALYGPRSREALEWASATAKD